MNAPDAPAIASNESAPPIPTVDRALRWREAIKDSAPTIAMIGTLLAAGALYFSSGDPASHYVGFAQVTPLTVASMETARVERVLVTVGQKVTAGQIVATLDTGTIDAEIAVAEAKRVELAADLRAEQALLEQDLDQALEGLERQRAIQREEQARASAEAKALEGEVARVKQLVEQRQAVTDDLAQLGLKQAAANAANTSKPRTIGVLSKQIKAAEERRQRSKEGSSVLAEKLAASLLVADRSIELLKKRRDSYALRAAQAGSVAAIDHHAGDVVDAGAPVVRLVIAEARVIACVPERSALSLREGDPARLTIRGRSSAPLHGHAVALGPVVTELPSRCWTSPRVPVWGREVTIALDAPIEMIAGQAFDVAFDPSPATSSAASAGVALSPSVAPPFLEAGAAGCAGSPDPKSAPTLSPMSVPADLARRTRFEPSGLIARPSESRYLVVSDDTGRGDHEGEPWIFAMSATGEIAPEPVKIAGVGEVDDLEAIAAGDRGEVYLLSSQSVSRKGHRKRARTAILRAQKDGAGLRVDGEAHLAEWLDQEPAQASALGLPDGTRALDIEGLAFRDGALFLGLKAPLDAEGRALVWKVASPSALFAGGPAGAGLSIWARAHVDVEKDGKPVPGGISDLLFFPDGSLALTSTPATAEGAAGALWRVDRPEGGVLSPRLIQRFPDAKPEGIAPSLGGGKLMIVFDAGAETPLYREVPWPP